MRPRKDADGEVLSERVDTPVGKECLHCDEAIVEGDAGFLLPLMGANPSDGGIAESAAYYHRACFLRTVVGSVGHQMRKCPCFGGSYEDPPGMTRREAARAAAVLFETNEMAALN